MSALLRDLRFLIAAWLIDVALTLMPDKDPETVIWLKHVCAAAEEIIKDRS